MKIFSENDNLPNGNQGKQNQIVNEQDQLEKINPSAQDSPKSMEDKQKYEEGNASGKINQPELKKDSKFKGGLKTDDGQLPGN